MNETSGQPQKIKCFLKGSSLAFFKRIENIQSFMQKVYNYDQQNRKTNICCKSVVLTKNILFDNLNSKNILNNTVMLLSKL